MTDFSIFHFDDNQDTLDNVDSYVISLNHDFKGDDIKINLTSFLNSIELVKEVREKKPNLIILDMYDKQPELRRVGEETLEKLKNLSINIPVIIFTQGSRDENSVDYVELYKSYPFLYDRPILKSVKANLLKEAIKKIVIRECLSGLFSYDHDDIFLSADIIAIGESNLNDVIFKIRSELNISNKIFIERLASGFSGAAVFKILAGNEVRILKISREKDKLRKELENAIYLYKKLPARFRIDINTVEYSNEEVLAILIEEVKMGVTLFKWLKSADNDAIDSFFNNLYFNGGLADHYSNNMREVAKFDAIFSGFDDGRVSIIKKCIADLKPILERYQEDIDFDEITLLNFLTTKIYGKLCKANLLGEKFEKNLVLCHGDFHSNNIMVQNYQPVLIDSGGLKYDFWCSDICRLIVHLFMLGVGDGSFNFFDITTLNQMYRQVENLCKLDKLDQTSDNSSGYVHAINWLLENVSLIFNTQFTKWEMQLGLMKELLQTSYRVTSVPHSRRTLALFAAYKCLLTASENIELL